MLNFTVITIFPQMLGSPLNHSILRKAQDNGLIKIDIVDLRDYTSDRHHTTDDSPYGGGQGMVMKAAPLVAAIESARSQAPEARVILLTPRGRVFDQHTAMQLSREPNVVLICGRYEGVDERVSAFVDEEISLGDYTLKRRRAGGDRLDRCGCPPGARRIRQRKFRRGGIFYRRFTGISPIHTARRVSRYEGSGSLTLRRS